MADWSIERTQLKMFRSRATGRARGIKEETATSDDADGELEAAVITTFDHSKMIKAWCPSLHFMTVLLAASSVASCHLGYVLGKASGTLQSLTLHYEDATAKAKSWTDRQGDPCSEPMTTKGVPTFKHRSDLANILQQENMTVGAELGVQQGHNARQMLTMWPSCTEFLPRL
jgi:hypothetical protein